MPIPSDTESLTPDGSLNRRDPEEGNDNEQPGPRWVFLMFEWSAVETLV